MVDLMNNFVFWLIVVDIVLFLGLFAWAAYDTKRGKP